MIIGISGKLGSGKSTLANMIINKFPNYEEKSFAFKLKEIVKILTSCNLSDTFTQEGKNKYIEEFDLTIGQMLQKLGTNVLRDHFDNNIWIKALLIELKNNDGNYIISDCRFKNEAKAIKDAGGILIRINRNNNPIALTSNRDLNHPSEIDLDDYTEFDYIIENDSDYSTLQSKINNILNKINI